MKYYKFEYDNTAQKIMWNFNSICLGFLCPVIMSLIVLIFPIPDVLIFILLVLSIIAGLILAIRNFKKLRGVFVFKDYLEVVGQYAVSRKIYFENIINIYTYDKLPISDNSYLMLRGGGRTNCLVIESSSAMAYVKVENQEELIEDIIAGCGKDFSQ